MTDSAAIPETVVFDAEPLIAYFCNEPGSDTVETYVGAVDGVADGYISAINFAESTASSVRSTARSAPMLSLTCLRKVALVVSTPTVPGGQQLSLNSATRQLLTMPSHSGPQNMLMICS